MDWFLYDNGLRHERVNTITAIFVLEDLTLSLLVAFFVVRITKWKDLDPCILRGWFYHKAMH